MRLYIMLLTVVLTIGSTAMLAAQDKDGEDKHLKVYPVEADKFVNIYVDFDEPTDFTLRIPPTDKNNEKKWQVNAKSSYQHSLNVQQLPQGRYELILTYNSKEEKMSFTVKRND